jgi:hypothetical protein
MILINTLIIRLMREYLPPTLAFASALVFYLGSARQQWLASPLPTRSSRAVAALLAARAVFAGEYAGHPVTTISIVLTTQMAAFVAFPFIAVLLGRARSAGAAR